MAQILATINPAQDYKWPIPMASLLFGSVSIAYQNFSPIACDISSVQASKGDTFSEALYMETALMQQPSHIWVYYCSNISENYILQSRVGDEDKVHCRRSLNWLTFIIWHHDTLQHGTCLYLFYSLPLLYFLLHFFMTLVFIGLEECACDILVRSPV